MKPQPSTPRLRARRLRRKQTDAERKLWLELRNRRFSGEKFRRQHPIGRFVVDFCCLEPCLIIELDGGQHATQTEADRERTAFLEREGYRVLRFWNHDVFGNMEAVLLRIEQALKNPHPGPPGATAWAQRASRFPGRARERKGRGGRLREG